MADEKEKAEVAEKVEKEEVAGKVEKDGKTGPLSDVYDESTIVEEPRQRRMRRIHLDLKCPFCESGVKVVAYKEVYQLKKYTSVRGKIIGRDKSGMCAKHQRQLTSAIKKARYMALLPYVSITK